jgi:hypothetical protein
MLTSGVVTISNSTPGNTYGVVTVSNATPGKYVHMEWSHSVTRLLVNT